MQLVTWLKLVPTHLDLISFFLFDKLLFTLNYRLVLNLNKLKLGVAWISTGGLRNGERLFVLWNLSLAYLHSTDNKLLALGFFG